MNDNGNNKNGNGNNGNNDARRRRIAEAIRAIQDNGDNNSATAINTPDQMATELQRREPKLRGNLSNAEWLTLVREVCESEGFFVDGAYKEKYMRDGSLTE